MKLKSVLRQHDIYKNRVALKNVLGDSFLLKKNPMYRQTRELALQLEYKYKPAWDSYKRAPLYELQTILKKKIIPYNDAVPTLQHLMRTHKVNDEMENIPVNLISNHFHESAHCISDAFFKKIKARNKSEKILLALLCESCANATESMAVTFIDNPVHQFFFAQNSYIYASQKRIKQRRQALAKWGAPALFRLLWLSYLHSNFLVEDMPRQKLEGIFRFALHNTYLSKNDIKLATSLFSDAYELNPNFRMKTARLYMNLLGIRGDVEKNLDFDFAQIFLNHTQLAYIFDQLANSSTQLITTQVT